MSKNFLFVIPKYVKAGEHYHFPIGIAYVSAYLRHQNFKVHCLNLCHSEVPVDIQLAQAIEQHKIDVVATGSLSKFWHKTKDILVNVKKIKPAIITILGGPIITSEPELAMQNIPVDYGVIGEGEETMTELAGTLCNGGDINNIKGLIFFNNEKELVLTPARPSLMNLDALPFPDYEAFEFDKLLSTIQNLEDKYLGLTPSPRPAEIIASRSCPYNCTFCYHPLGRIYRQRSLDNFFGEVDYLVNKFQINAVNMLDELLSAKKDRLYEIAARIKKYNLSWVANLRVDHVDEEMLRVVKDSGAFLIFFGVESINDEILKSMKKKITRKKIENTFSLCAKIGVRANGHLILGDVKDTKKTINNSIKWWLKHKQYNINLDFILAIPNSQIYQYALRKGIIKNKLEHILNRFPIVNLTEISDKIFNRIIEKVRYCNDNRQNLLQGKVKSSEKIAETKKYLFTVECPICHNSSDYVKERLLKHPWITVICHHCYKMIKVSSYKAFAKEFKTLKHLIYYKILYRTNFFMMRFYLYRQIMNLLMKAKNF